MLDPYAHRVAFIAILADRRIGGRVFGRAHAHEMVNPVQLAAQLRFHLSELGSRNAHHEFEHLARHLARARIYSNILPATGPVSAGGDGGRDFETFRTGIALPVAGSRFAARSSREWAVAFACSLEKRIERKIRSDVEKILATGKVDEIVYFCEANLPIAKRQEFVTAASGMGAELQIFDGNTIAEWLAEPDLFWIAEEFLHVPAEISPQMQSDDDGYAQHKVDWKARTVLPISRADFVAIKAGLRHATFEPVARPDLSFWIERMAGFLVPMAPRDLVRSASYEIAVAHLRGRGDMTSQAHLVADYFVDVEAHTDIGDLTTAATLLTYAFGGYWLGQFLTKESDLHDYRCKLADAVQSELDEAIGPGRRAGLLHVRALLAQTPAGPGLAPDFSAVIALWNAMLDSAEQASLYPIEAFADLLVEIVKLRGDDPELMGLAARADDLLAERMGGVAAGEKAIDRALSLLERDQPAAAIRELHRAKAKWFSGGRLVGAVRILVLLAEQYRQHGLAYAAKYHAMTAALLTRYEREDGVRRLQPETLLELLDAEDGAGNSFGFLRLLPVFVQAHIFHDDHPLNTERHPRLQSNLGQLASLLGFVKRGSPTTRQALDELVGEWPPLLRDPILSAANKPDGFWNRGTWPEAWTGLEEALLDRPFGDLGLERHVRWEGLGIRWTCVFLNDYRTTPPAEQIIAELQLVVFAFANRDLGIVPVDFTMNIEVSDAIERLTVEELTETRAAFRVTLPSRDRGPEESGDVLLVFAAALRAISVLDDEALARQFDRSVLEPTFVGRPYAELFREFVPEDLFAELFRQSIAPLDPERPFVSRAGGRVQWFDGPGPTFELERALGDAQNRYDKVLVSLRYTISGIAHDPGTRARLLEMHERGMKDWEILSILSNIAMGIRLDVPEDLPLEELRSRGMALLDKVETEADALLPAVFTDELLHAHAKVYLGAFFSSWQLHWPPSVDYEGAEKFLVSRFRLRDVDVPHQDVFGWDQDDAPLNP